MSEHFIKEIEIKNFKLFKDFKAEGFGRVNLIGGKNNVGKTAFMEACYLSTSIDVRDIYLKYIEFNTNRDGINSSSRFEIYSEVVENLINLVEFEIVVNKTHEISSSYFGFKYNFVLTNNQRVEYEYDYEELAQYLNSYMRRNRYKRISHQFIVVSNSYPNVMFDDIISQVKQQRKYHDLNTIIQDSFGLDGIDIIKGVPYIIDYSSTIDYPISELGQGIKSFILYIASILISENTHIFIDEIDSGIHYTLFDTLWEIILTVSKAQNVQVFATTHSKECIESYARVAKRLRDKDVKYIKLSKLRNGSIYAGVRDYDTLQYVVDDEIEVR